MTMAKIDSLVTIRVGVGPLPDLPEKLYRIEPGQVHQWPRMLVELDDDRQLEALIPCMRQSAQGTLAALRRAGFRIVKEGA